MPVIYSNFAKTYLANQVLSGDTKIAISNLANFPVFTGAADEYYKVTFVYGVNYEIVYVTGIFSGNQVNVLRAQEGTTAQTWPAGETVVVHAPMASDHKFFQSLQNRANHVGTQPASSIIGLDEIISEIDSTGLSIDKGGTGAKTVTQAKANLGIATVGSTGKFNDLVEVPKTLITSTSVKTAAFNAVAGVLYPCDTNGSAFTVTMPVAPVTGDTIGFLDYSGTFGTKNLTINFNGKKFLGTVQTYILDQNNYGRYLYYVDETKGWMVK